MTDQPLPPSGAVPPVPPAPQPVDGQPPMPGYAPAPPAPPAYEATPPANQPAPPAYEATPPAYQPQTGLPAYQPHTAPPAYASAPPAYQAAPPAYQSAPPGAYQVPVGGYSAPAGDYQAPATEPKKSGMLGILALVAAGIAALIIPIIAGFTSFEIGTRLPGGFDATGSDALAALAPARDQVLWTEIAFWTGTVLGIAAIVIGIIAIVKKKGRGAGIAAVVVAALGAVVFWVVVGVMLPAGVAAGLVV